MKKVYLLAFSDSVGTIEQVGTWASKMKTVKTWRYDMSNAIYLVSFATAQNISDEFRRISAGKGRYILTEISENSDGWLTNESWHLINNKELLPKSS